MGQVWLCVSVFAARQWAWGQRGILTSTSCLVRILHICTGSVFCYSSVFAATESGATGFSGGLRHSASPTVLFRIGTVQVPKQKLIKITAGDPLCELETFTQDSRVGWRGGTMGRNRVTDTQLHPAPLSAPAQPSSLRRNRE